MTVVKKVTEIRASRDEIKLDFVFENGGFGFIYIKYANNGHYDIDAEFLDFDTVAEIIKLWKS